MTFSGLWCGCVHCDFSQLSYSTLLCPLSALCTSTCPDICLKLSTICTGLRLSVCVRWAVIWLFNCVFVCVQLWGFVDAWQHMFLLWACVCKYVKRKCIRFHQGERLRVCLCVCRFACIYVRKMRIPECVHASECCPVFIFVCECFRASGWMSAVRCCSMLCQLHLEPSVLRLSGSRADDFNVLEPQTDLSQTVVSIKPRQLGPAKLNRRIWVVSRRQTLWLHYNPRSDSLGSLLAARYAQTLESVCFNDTMVIYCMRILFAAQI